MDQPGQKSLQIDRTCFLNLFFSQFALEIYSEISKITKKWYSGTEILKVLFWLSQKPTIARWPVHCSVLLWKFHNFLDCFFYSINLDVFICSDETRLWLGTADLGIFSFIKSQFQECLAQIRDSWFFIISSFKRMRKCFRKNS